MKFRFLTGLLLVLITGITLQACDETKSTDLDNIDSARRVAQLVQVAIRQLQVDQSSGFICGEIKHQTYRQFRYWTGIISKESEPGLYLYSNLDTPFGLSGQFGRLPLGYATFRKIGSVEVGSCYAVINQLQHNGVKLELRRTIFNPEEADSGLAAGLVYQVVALPPA